MKKILFTLLFLVAFFAGYSQMNNNGGTITVESGATLVIEGNYTSSNNAVIEIDGAVQLKGNFINNSGTVSTGSTGHLTFTGTNAQEITGSQSTTFYCAVEVDKASNGVALTSSSTGANQFLDSTLILTSGKLTLNQFNLTLSNEGVTGASSSKYIVTSGAGQLRAGVGASNYTFPVGLTSYNPIILNEAGTADTFGVIFTDGLPGSWGGGLAHTVLGNWAVTDKVSGGNNLTATTQWNSGQEQTSFANTDCAVGVTTNSGTTVAWKPSGAATGGSGVWARSGSGFNSVGQFMVGDYFFEGIDLDLDVFLAGPYSAGTMSTALKTNNLIPLQDPYGNVPDVASIPANVVDWIEVQLRSGSGSTIVKRYSAFLDNNGNVLNTDGSVGTKLTGVTKAPYYVAVRHRNHLGAMTLSTIDFTTGTAFAFDFSAGSGIYGSSAMRNMGAKWALWAGDANQDGQIIYQGSNNDPTPIGNYISGFSSSFTYVKSNVYSAMDINMDGSVIYQGSNNDPTPIGNSVSSHPGNPGNSFTYVIAQQLP